MDTSKIIEVIANQLGVSADDINEDTDIMDDLGADSLDIVEMLMTFEDDYGIAVPDEDVVNFRKIKDIAEYLEKNA